MKKFLLLFVYLCFSNIFWAISQNKKSPFEDPDVLSEVSKIIISKDIELTQVKDSFFVHTSWFEHSKFGRFPSNGLIFIKNGKVLIIDTPNNNEQTEILCNYLNQTFKVKIKKLIVGHYHNDCLGGLEYLTKIGVSSLSNKLTKEKCIENKLAITSEIFMGKKILDFEGETVICQYFGGGHTIDNIVVYFPDHKLLFGGCLIKDLKAKNLGNTEEAVIKEWKKTVEKISAQYPNIEYVIPGHGEYGNSQLLYHTIKLVEQQQK